MAADQESVSRTLLILSHTLRRQILFILSERGSCSFTDLMKALEVDTGKLSFHIRNLQAFLDQTPEGQYQLSKAGQNAVRLIKDVESWVEVADVATKVSTLPFSSWQRRAIAYLIDLSLMVGIALLFSVPNTLLTSGGGFRLDINLVIFLTLGLLWGYSTLLEGFEGQSLGKRVMGLKVLRIDGKKPSYDNVAIRNFGKAFLLPFDLFVGLRLHDKRYIRYFDKFAGTTVVDTRNTLELVN